MFMNRPWRGSFGPSARVSFIAFLVKFNKVRVQSDSPCVGLLGQVAHVSFRSRVGLLVAVQSV